MSEIQAEGVTEMSSGAPLPDSTNSMTAYLGYVTFNRLIRFYGCSGGSTQNLSASPRY
mgnify:CR=1 FL=1